MARDGLAPALAVPTPTGCGTCSSRKPAAFCRARPGRSRQLDVTEADAAAIEEICRRVDGIPLAIELAAARIAHLAPRQIADRLDDRFRLLARGRASQLPRHDTLRSLVVLEPRSAVGRRTRGVSAVWRSSPTGGRSRRLRRSVAKARSTCSDSLWTSHWSWWTSSRPRCATACTRPFGIMRWSNWTRAARPRGQTAACRVLSCGGGRCRAAAVRDRAAAAARSPRPRAREPATRAPLVNREWRDRHWPATGGSTLAILAGARLPARGAVRLERLLAVARPAEPTSGRARALNAIGFLASSRVTTCARRCSRRA